MSVRIIVIDNDAEAPARVPPPSSGTSIPVVWAHEAKPGKSSALNTGLTLCTGEYVGFVDDDEEVDENWFAVAHEVLTTAAPDFVGGRSLPLWIAPPPPWLPASSPAVLGIVDSGNVRCPYGPEFPGMLTGGNAIIRRSLLVALGGFVAELGPSRTHRLLSGEDEELYLRLLRSGANGLYVPELIVRHHIHPERLHKRYYRAWYFWNGTAKGLLARDFRQPVPHLFGVPRYLYGSGIRACIALLRSCVSLDYGATLDREAPLWLLAGFLNGRYFHHRAATDMVALKDAAHQRVVRVVV